MRKHAVGAQISAVLLLLAVMLLFVPAVLGGCSNKELPVSTSFAIQGSTTKESGEHLELDLNVPVLSGFDAAKIIDGRIDKNIKKAKQEVEDAAKFLGEDGSTMKAGLTVGYLYSKSENIVSLWVMYANYTGGAHGLYWVEPYTFNTTTNEIYRFTDLFREGRASSAYVTEQILKRIQENPDLYFSSADETVKKYHEDYTYFVNGNQVVVIFSLYEIAPYAGGIQFFTFTAEELKDLLKPEIYNAIKNAKPVDTKGTILEY
ncbi:DUF3298 domain-containing protein [Anoxybacterium hadale]|uniref:DUF3298 and DUF4163 domain-containing protein n=1 Tax=Anoxybacterium hadale TaxID=3408580 RepID=UPI003AFF87BE